MKKLNTFALTFTIFGPVLFIVLSMIYSVELNLRNGYIRPAVTFWIPLMAVVINSISFFKKSTSRLTSLGLIIINILYIIISTMLSISAATR